MTGVRLVFVTGPDAATVGRLARTLVEERLIACANLVDGVRSIYRWEGRIEEAGEALAILKTTAERVEALQARILELHPYDVPEILAVPVSGGAEAYLDWVGASVRPES